MIKSMTAYAIKNLQVNTEEGQIDLCWEIRTVNHRYLDISLNLPESLNANENKLKELVRNKLGRGKFDAKLTLSVDSIKNGNDIPLDKKVVESLLSARHMLESISKKPITLSGMDILNWPGVLIENKNNGKDYIKHVERLLDDTLNELIVTRESEGKRLLEMILSRCDVITGLVKDVRERRVVVMSSLRQKVLKRLVDIDVNADPSRLEQEMVFQAQRLDVDEELDRLDSHIEEIRSVLVRDEAVGRRLDFLMQELYREANTLSSKSNDAETTRSSVDLKVLIEQMREQCLNIE